MKFNMDMKFNIHVKFNIHKKFKMYHKLSLFNWIGIVVLVQLHVVCRGLKGYSTIYSLRLRDSRDSRDSQDSETPETPRLPRLRDSRGFCHITFQFSFISDLPLFQIFQILQILKWKWKWKDPTFAIFFKNMGFKDVEYNIPETLRLPRLPRLWDSETKRGQNHKM